MGYELHIERDDSQPISSADWLEVVANDPELELTHEGGEFFARYLGGAQSADQARLGWCDGQISAKYPDNTVLAKMLAIARQLDAAVKGDDGEIYTKADIHSGVQPEAPAPRVTWRDRLLDRWYRTFPRRNKTPLPFKVGDRVRDASGMGVVVAINRRADHGMGRVTVQYDNGRKGQSALIAHGLDKVETSD